MLRFWTFFAVFTIGVLLLGAQLGMLIQNKKPCPVPDQASYVPQPFCIGLDGGWACAVQGELVLYDKRGNLINNRDPDCDTKPPTKFCADKGTSFTPNTGPLNIE